MRILVAVAGVLVLGTTAAMYVALTAEHARNTQASADAVPLAPGPRLLFRSTADPDRGQVSMVSVTDPGGPRAVSPLSCTRIYVAGGTGLCLRADTGLTTELVVLDGQLEEKREIPLFGLPSRARVSPSGRMVAWTVFVTGDSYNATTFSTRTGILDTATDELVRSLEDFSVDGNPYPAADVNFWGVTFAKDDNRFFATMSTGGHRFLVQGDVAAHAIRTVRANVECPSLSPDGTRLAFKSAINDNPAEGWQLSTLDLNAGTVTPLADTRSIDDQPAWLDNHTIAYSIPRVTNHTDVWSVPADGTGTPYLLIPDAESPAALG